MISSEQLKIKTQSLKAKLKFVFVDNFFKTIFLLLGISIFAFYLLYHHETTPNHLEVRVNDTIIYAQVADTENERSLGLSFTKKLEENAGMLFVFDEVGVKNFWMRDMNYNIDIVWLDENKTVTGFVENADKNSYFPKRPADSKIYRSPENTKYVLEVATGTIVKLKIKAGDVLDFNY